MKADITTKMYRRMGYKEDHENVNSYMKAIIINFGDARGDIIVKNDNYGTDRKYADFTNGKKEAGLHPAQVVFSGVTNAKLFHDRYIDSDNIVRTFE